MPLGAPGGSGRAGQSGICSPSEPLPKDPTRPITSFKTAWAKVREKAGVKGRWHDNRHTLVTELAESGGGDEVIMRRRALDEIATRQRTADEKREREIERQRHAEIATLSLTIQ
jgi:hypothetical protein